MVILILKSVFASLAFTVLTVIFGLSQLWITFGLAFFKKGAHYDVDTMLRDGVLLFFIMGIVASIALDYYFSKAPRFPRTIEAILFVLYPLLTTAFVVFAYSAVYWLKPDQVDYDHVRWAQYIAIVLAFVYSLFGKYVQFYNGLRKIV